MKRAIGITRVSAEGDRETIHSYATQADRITTSCQRDHLELLYIGQERNVSGGASLTNRPELSRAVEAVEAGRADVIVAAYFDRFFRSLETQAEVIRRVEAAGGEVLALDHGRLTNATSAQRLSANIMGAIAAFHREQTAEKVRDGHRAAVTAGKLPYPGVPLGYRKGADGVLQPDKATAGIVRELFERRAADESIHSLSRWMTEQGYRKSTTGVRAILKSRIYLGEIRFGDLLNLSAHEPIITPEAWAAAQNGKGDPGRPPLGAPRLLARLGVLRCECGALMALGNRVQVLPLKGRTEYPFYRCGSNPPCSHRTTIQAPIAEEKVWNTVRDAMRGMQGRASMAESAQDAISRLSSAQTALDTALRVFELTGAQNETAAVERIKALVTARDTAQAEVDRIGPDMEYAADPDDLSFDRRRQAIRSWVRSATVTAGGRGADRIVLDLRA